LAGRKDKIKRRAAALARRKRRGWHRLPASTPALADPARASFRVLGPFHPRTYCPPYRGWTAREMVESAYRRSLLTGY